MPPQNLRKTTLPRERKVERQPEGFGVRNLESKFDVDGTAGGGADAGDEGSESIRPVYLAGRKT